MDKKRSIHNQIKQVEIEGLEKIQKQKFKRPAPWPRNLRDSVEHDLDFRGMKVIVPKNKPDTVMSGLSIYQDLSEDRDDASIEEGRFLRKCGLTKEDEDEIEKQRRRARR